MLGLTTLRSRLLAAMLGTALLALAVAYLVVGAVQRHDEHASDLAKAHRVATTVAQRLIADQRSDPDDIDASHFAAIQSLLVNDRLVVRRGNRVLYAGPAPRGRRLELSSTARFPGGSVTVHDYTAPEQDHSVTATIVGAAVAGVVILTAIVVATLLTRAVREPVRRAISAADTVAAGDLSARMGTTGPAELARLGRAFDGMADRLQSADRDQRRFLADVAHEIATPTNTISGFGLALADGTLRTDAERTEAAELIGRETARLRSLLDDLRELTRLDLADTVRRRRFDIGELCGRVAARARTEARAANVTLDVRVGHGTIVSDERLLDTILSNLVANAIRYTPAGGRVVLNRRRSRHELVLAVSDTGVGIAAEDQDRIFDRLYRVDPARGRDPDAAKDPGGTGLGLPIAQRAVHALGGRIELCSELGRGSEFRVVLPLSGQHDQGESSEAGAKPAAGADASDAASNRGSTSENVDPAGDEDTVQRPP